ncbi:glycosyltransferase family 4 protein [uncultured Microbacterium sp.]|uniref:glycosyltransferase family 4 protein n=1 Tax=uncultured Microbacterium sp. TaxID=191216 RepID=UPI0025CE25C0|nr:glycosyltransferase family 4 protein [uncultured Microbacterium sp.]
MQKIDWLTGRAAPYRRPIWDVLGNRFDFQIRLLENSRQFHCRPGNRPDDWYEFGLRGADTAFVPTKRLQRGEENYYLALRSPVRRGVDGVILGGWESPAYWQALAQLKTSRRPVRSVGFYESTLASQGHKNGPIAAARRWYFRNLDAVVVPGEASAEAVAAMGVDDHRIFVGFNPVDVDWIARESTRSPLRGRGHRFIYIGQLVPRKAPLALIQAFAHCRDEADTLTIVGKGELARAVNAEIDRLGLSETVELFPTVSYQDVPALLARHDTLVLPSLTEVWGLVVNEALAAGLHVVVSRNAGVAPSVADMDGVHLCEPEREAIAQAMAASRASWAGPVRTPAILAFTPQRFADVFVRALNQS